MEKTLQRACRLWVCLQLYRVCLALTSLNSESTTMVRGRGDGAVGKMLAMKPWEMESDLRQPSMKPNVCVCTPGTGISGQTAQPNK